VKWINGVTTPDEDANNTLKGQFPDLAVYLASLPLSRKDISSRQRIELDQKGVQLWNACCRVNSSEGVDEKVKLHVAQCESIPPYQTTICVQ
jgi:hypothetical protein